MHIDINSMISKYGYLAIFMGCLTEGETIILLGGMAAQKGLLNYGYVVLAAMLGGAIGDQLLFIIGCYYSSNILQRFKKKRPILHFNQMICRRPLFFTIIVRFMYGFRIAGPMIIGASQLSFGKFFIFNIIGALLWSLIFVSIGYLGGEMILPWLHNIDQYIKYLLWLITAIFMIWLVRKILRNLRLWYRR
ncbi:MAG: DedA family protein [Candidatus Dasytiphilus stammeri]